VSDESEIDAKLIGGGHVYISSCDPHVKATYARDLLRHLAEVRKQRDTLAEALRKVRDYQGNFGEDDPKSVAIEALAAVEGGQS
jgi:hypothetical protein